MKTVNLTVKCDVDEMGYEFPADAIELLKILNSARGLGCSLQLGGLGCSLQLVNCGDPNWLYPMTIKMNDGEVWRLVQDKTKGYGILHEPEYYMPGIDVYWGWHVVYANLEIEVI